MVRCFTAISSRGRELGNHLGSNVGGKAAIADRRRLPANVRRFGDAAFNEKRPGETPSRSWCHQCRSRLFGFFTSLVEGRTEDVSQRCAGVGRADRKSVV